MIRQAISCDICGAEKRQTNHWFVACEQSGELRLSGWSSRTRQRPGAKHLCGQTCLHKLVDEYIARTIDARSTTASADPPAISVARSGVDASLTSRAAFRNGAPAARLTSTQPLPETPAHAASELAVLPLPARRIADPPATAPLPPLAEIPQYASRRWRAEAWERERKRESHTSDRHFDFAPLRKGI